VDFGFWILDFGFWIEIQIPSTSQLPTLNSQLSTPNSPNSQLSTPNSQHTMTTTTPQLNQLEITINQALASHKERIQLQQEQIQSLTQLLNTRRNSNLDTHCMGAMNRLVELLDRQEQSNGQVYNILTSLKDAKSLQNVTVDGKGEMVTYLNLELDELAQRLGVPKTAKLLTAAHNKVAWLKLMSTYPDPDGYQWQFPTTKSKGGFGFYHKNSVHAIGVKAIDMSAGKSTLN
jgi:hypothetical protein